MNSEIYDDPYLLEIEGQRNQKICDIFNLIYADDVYAIKTFEYFDSRLKELYEKFKDISINELAVIFEQQKKKLENKYYQILKELLVNRYLRMAKTNYQHELVDFIENEFLEKIDKEYPLYKLNRWLGYVQGQLIARGITTVEDERDHTRPLFRPIDFLVKYAVLDRENGKPIIAKKIVE